MKNRNYTQSKALNILSETRVTVVSFDKKTGVRDLQYGGLDLLSAIQHISIRQEDWDVLICDGYLINKWECNFKTRINITTAKNMTIKLDLF